MYGTLLFIHILGATVWTGGHLLLSLVILPKVLKKRAPGELLKFETAFERIGMPALIIQVLTGLLLAYHRLPDISEWFAFSHPASHAIAAKLILLFLTLAFALDAKFRVIPRLSEENLTDMAWHIIPVTLFSVLFVLVGVSFRTGWLS